MLRFSVGLLVIFSTMAAQAAPFNFVKIVEASFSGPLFDVAAPSLENGKVAFAASTSFGSPNAIYSNASGTLIPVADASFTVPGSSFGFGSVGSKITLDGGVVAFQGGDNNGISGIYTGNGGPVVKLVDTTETVPPANSSNFESFGRPAYENGNLVVYGTHNFFAEGIYTTFNGPLAALADANTAIPGGSGNFTSVSSLPVTDGTIAAFVGHGGGGYSGLFAGDHSSLLNIVDTDDLAPGGTGNFSNFSAPSVDAGKLAFIAYDQAAQAIYSNHSGSLQQVFSTNTAVPQQAGNFEQFQYLVLKDGKMTFVGSSNFGAIEGIYTNMNGTLEKVVARDDVIGGKIVNAVSLSETAVDDGQIAFKVSFNDGTQSIYLASVSAPTAVQPESVAVELTTGSPITLAQNVNTPASDFNLVFDYKFITTSGHLDVSLDGTIIGSLLAPEVLESGFSTASFPVTGALLSLSGVPLEFTLDGPTGSKLLIDNISFPGLTNGDFETGTLGGWTTSGAGSAGAVSLSASLAVIPEPSSLCLLQMLCVGAMLLRRRVLRSL